MIVSKVDPFTGLKNELDLNITVEQILDWQNGALIQNAMPQLTPDEREFLISGVMPESWAVYVDREDV